jgi:hypothetical protein
MTREGEPGDKSDEAVLMVLFEAVTAVTLRSRVRERRVHLEIGRPRQSDI